MMMMSYTVGASVGGQENYKQYLGGETRGKAEIW